MKTGIPALVLLLGGCASFPVNPPLERLDPDSGYRLENLEPGRGNSEETYVVVSLSGGVSAGCPTLWSAGTASERLHCDPAPEC